MKNQVINASFEGSITRVEDKGKDVVFTVEVERAKLLRGLLRDLMNGKVGFALNATVLPPNLEISLVDDE